jgi:alkylresorcinol/alkylpyrone synthase/polyketide synthase Type III
MRSIEPADRPRILAAGTAAPPHSYTQDEMLDMFGVADPRIRSIFRNSAIDRRHLYLPPVAANGTPAVETQGQLLEKQRRYGIELGAQSLQEAAKSADVDLADLGYLCCVTTTGLLTPGFSALLLRELALSPQCGRLDVVGMGCNAGLNALTAVAGWAAANPGRPAALVCIEVCSAAYVFDGSMRSSVVNSLFGDGSGAVIVAAGEQYARPGRPVIRKFASRMIPEALSAMRYDWNDGHGKYSFYLDRDIPYVVGAHAEEVVGRLLAGTGLRRSDITHWVVHSGGKKVIDSVKINLGLTAHDVRHTSGVLRDYGNLSSGSFLFSYQRLVREGLVQPGEHGVLMTMGPGSTIETALIQW